MSALPGENPISTQPAGQQRRKQRTTSSTQPPQRRYNNHNRKSDQFDGAVSDSGVLQPADSPRISNVNHGQRPNTTSSSQTSSSAYKQQSQRPPSVNAGAVLRTPAKEQAYAGPTFQASPAASSLPLPKFFAKSLSRATGQPSQHGRTASEGVLVDGSSSPEADAVALPARESQQSPLDLFFRADKLEKEKSRSGGGSPSPESARRPPQPATAPRGVHASGKGIFLRELDGDDGSVLITQPAMTGRRPNFDRANSSPGVQTRFDESEADRQAKTNSLKGLLWNIAVTPPSSRHHDHFGSQTLNDDSGSPSPSNHPRSGVSTPQTASGHQQGNYSLHYGNRNLSPMFTAARSETPPNPSSLRQEIGSIPLGNNRRLFHDPASSNPHSSAHPSLREQATAPRPTTMPEYASDDPRPLSGWNDRSSSIQIPAAPSNAQSGGSDSVVPARPDVRSMEDDIRRMLKIS